MNKLKEIIPYLIGVVMSLSIAFQWYHYQEFVKRMNQFTSKGPRFTAIDGQHLCEKIKQFENRERKNHPEEYIDIEKIECNYIK